MPLKVWAAYERLTADDLNANFAFDRPRACRLRRTTDVALGAAAFTDVLMESAVFDPDAMMSAGGLVIPVAGLWQLDGEFTFTGATPTLGIIGWVINGVTPVTLLERWYIPSPTATVGYRGYLVRVMAAGDTVRMQVFPQTAVTLTEGWLGARLIQPS